MIVELVDRQVKAACGGLGAEYADYEQMQETGGQILCGSCLNGSKGLSLLVLSVVAVSVVIGGKPRKLHLGVVGWGEMRVGQCVAVAERGEVWNIH